MNPQEKFLFDSLDAAFKPYITGATLSLKQYLRLQQSYLTIIYGDLGDWKSNLARYEVYAKQNPLVEGAGVIVSIDDIPELSQNDMRKWLEEEQRDTELIEEFLKAHGVVLSKINGSPVL